MKIRYKILFSLLFIFILLSNIYKVKADSINITIDYANISYGEETQLMFASKYNGELEVYRISPLTLSSTVTLPSDTLYSSYETVINNDSYYVYLYSLKDYELTTDFYFSLKDKEKSISSPILKYSFLTYAYDALGYTSNYSFSDKLVSDIKALLDESSLSQIENNYLIDHLATDKYYQVTLENGYFLNDLQTKGLYKEGEDLSICSYDEFEDLPFCYFMEDDKILGLDDNLNYIVPSHNVIIKAYYDNYQNVLNKAYGQFINTYDLQSVESLSDITLPSFFEGVNISYSSNNPSLYISNDGTIQLINSQADTSCKLKANFSFKSESLDNEYNYVIPKKIYQTGTQLIDILFEFGEKGEAKHSDGGALNSATNSFTSDDYTLSFTSYDKVYKNARDAYGNSCLKLGTAEINGTFSFTVPDDIISVSFYVSQYKSNKGVCAIIKAGEKEFKEVVTKCSNTGEYNEINIDTSVSKTITFTSCPRLMIDKIVYHKEVTTSYLEDYDRINLDIINFNPNMVYNSLYQLKDVGVNGSKITYEEVSDTSILTQNYQLVNNLDQDIMITLLITYEYNDLFKTRVYDILVSKINIVKPTNNYYNDINTFLGDDLLLELRELLTNTHVVTKYDNIQHNSIMAKTKQDKNIPGNIILLYSRKSVNGTWDGGVTYNLEHIWCRSLGWFEFQGAGCDLFNLAPANPKINSTRNNNLYGEVVNGKKYFFDDIVTDEAFWGEIKDGYFEPIDEIKGDIARTIFYLKVRYSESDTYDFTSIGESFMMFKKWHEEDPVSDEELTFNESVYAIQKNRNPFIDNPLYVDYIWDDYGELIA